MIYWFILKQKVYNIAFKWNSINSLRSSKVFQVVSLFPFYGYYILYNKTLGNLLSANNLTSLDGDFLFLETDTRFLYLFLGSGLLLVFSLLSNLACPAEIKISGDKKTFIRDEKPIYLNLYFKHIIQRLKKIYPSEWNKISVETYNRSDGKHRMARFEEASFRMARKKTYPDVFFQEIGVIKEYIDVTNLDNTAQTVLGSFFSLIDISKTRTRVFLSILYYLGILSFFIPTFDLTINVFLRIPEILFFS